MKFHGLACILALAGSLAAADAPAQRPAFETFRLVRTRNIFDPDRRMSSQAAARAPSGAAPSDYVALTGTLVTADKVLAFFSGSRPEFNTVLGLSGTVANIKVTGITPLQIEVNRAGKAFVIAVGQQLALDGTAPVASVVPDVPDASSAPPDATPPSAPGQEDIVRRMMERRQKETR